MIPTLDVRHDIYTSERSLVEMGKVDICTGES